VPRPVMVDLVDTLESIEVQVVLNLAVDFVFNYFLAPAVDDSFVGNAVYTVTGVSKSMFGFINVFVIRNSTLLFLYLLGNMSVWALDSFALIRL